jgi:hypothetical protein
VITFAPHASAPLLIMEPSYTAVVLVDHKFQALSECFKIKTAPSDEIFDLKEKVKETIPISFPALLSMSGSSLCGSRWVKRSSTDLPPNA